MKSPNITFLHYVWCLSNMNEQICFECVFAKCSEVPWENTDCMDKNLLSTLRLYKLHFPWLPSVIYWYICAPHYNDVIMGAIASQITSLTIVYSTVYSDADQRKHQRSASLAFVRVNHRGPVNSPHKWPVTRKMLPLDDVIMICHKIWAFLWSWH